MAAMTGNTLAGDGLFARMRAAAGEGWRAYIEHPFVRRLGDGSLPEAAFHHYLAQDYLFLIDFARAWALAGYKAETLDDIRAASEGLRAIVDVEMDLHVAYCADWGISRAALEATPPAPETKAYTDYVFACGTAGDLLDLHVALSPCIVGYGEIGARLMAAADGTAADNPYRSWIEMYGGEEYQAAAAAEVATLDRLSETLGGGARLARLQEIFNEATRLEAAFWQMGLNAGEAPA